MDIVSPNRDLQNLVPKTTMDIIQSRLSLSPFPPPNKQRWHREHESCPARLFTRKQVKGIYGSKIISYLEKRFQMRPPSHTH